MTEGNLGIIACPILEDEMIYCLSNDKEVGKILILDNDHAQGTKKKFDKYGIKYDLCSEDDFLDDRVKLPEGGYNVAVWMMDLGLHEEPEQLRDHVKESCMRMQSSVDTIALYYGLCGNGLKDVDKWCNEGIDIPLTIMRGDDGRICDDCVAVAIGGTSQYLKLLRKHPGILYFTPAYAVNWDHMVERMELFKGMGKTDESLMKMIFEMANYHYVMEIPTGLGDEEEFHLKTKAFAEKMEFEVLQLEKEWCTMEPTRKMYAESKKLLRPT
jgi:Protein of unknown function (DUF1638).